MKAEQTTPTTRTPTDKEAVQARRARFIAAYIELRDPRKAALRAGFTATNATRTGGNLLKCPDVRRHLATAGVQLPDSTEKPQAKKRSRRRKQVRQVRARRGDATARQAEFKPTFVVDDVVTVDRSGRVSLGDLKALPECVSVVVDHSGLRISVRRSWPVSEAAE